MWRKWLLIVVQIGILFLFSILGTWIQHFFNLAIPGSVIGLVMLFLLLLFNVIPEQWISTGAKLMTRHLILFFIPATVGIIAYYELFIGKGIVLVMITIVSTLIVLVVSGVVSEKIAIWRKTKNV